jgi:flavin reductase (DIM6/NTAB) family NADH-FMN oxidoreductase RutF
MIYDTSALSGRERYQLLTSLVVPRPIAWVSTRSHDGTRNLAPFSYFAALSATPMLVGVSIGSRANEPKDTLRNIRETGAFCINVTTERHLEAMNASAGEWGPQVDEFERAGVQALDADSVDAPYVVGCPAVLECRLCQEVPLAGSNNTLVIGEVLCVRLEDGITLTPGTLMADADALRPVGRLSGEGYALMGEMPKLPRPPVD